VDGGCCTTPKLCWRCCTTLAVPTCLYHFNQMGLIDRGLRLASGIISQQVRQQEAASAAAVVQQDPAPPAAASIAPPSLPPQLAQIAQPPPAADLTALLTALSTQLGSLAAVVQSQSQELAEIKAAQSAAMLPALLPPPPAALLHGLPPLVQPPLPAAQPLPPPVPAAAAVHRQRALGMSSPAALNNLFDALEVDSDEDDGKHPDRAEVSTQRTQPQTELTLVSRTVFPPSLAPPAVGSTEDGTQQLARLLTSFNKTTVKYAKLDDLAEAIDDWFKTARKSGWPSAQLQAIYDYRHFVIDDIGGHSSLADTIKYHTLFAKAVQAGEHDLFSPNGHFNAYVYVKVFPRTTGSSSLSSSSSSAAGKKGKKGKKDTAASGATTEPKAKVFPVGACIHHPTSTSHDTSMCIKKDK
jgi:hypothetical protein